MKISRNARDKYNFEDSLFTERGNIKFDGNIHQVRSFVQNINQKRDLINFPELAVKTSEIFGIGLITEISEYVYDLYVKDLKTPDVNLKLYKILEEKYGVDALKESTKLLVEEFPPESVYKNVVDSDEFLSKKNNGETNEVVFLEEFISLWIGNANPAFSPYLEFFDDDKLEKQTKYLDIVDTIQDFFSELPNFKYTNKNIIETIQEPIKKEPYSIRKQIEYIRENWAEFLGKWGYVLLTALDLIKEEEKMRGFGPGKPQVPDFGGLDIENYSADSDWMPRVIMIAKNSYVWLDQLSKKYKRSITTLDQIPEEELKDLADYGFTALWLIGLWERSPASKTIKKWCGNMDAEASAYSLFDYVIAADLGGYNSYIGLKERAQKYGIRLASDMVPNHTGIDSKWVRENPDWFVSLPYPAFPSYQYSGESLSGDPNIGIYLEDKYFSKQDAAVTFKRVDFRTGDTKYIYHGNDGTSMPWNDTAQLNYLIPEVREAVIQTIIRVAKMFPIIRFDAAMTLTRLHYQRLWFPEPGSGGDIPSRAGQGLTKAKFAEVFPEEFWREVVDRVKQEVPDTLLLAEAFWLLEGFFVRTLGMHRVYNSIFMNALRDEDNALYRTSIKKALEFDRRMLKRFVNFMNNPDEETASNQFGTGEKYFGICLLLVTMPGLPMIGHGQIEGFKEKYGMEFRRAYWDEKVDEGLLNHHKKTIFPIMHKRYIFSGSENFYLYDFWADGNVNEDVFAFSNKYGDERGFVVYNNRFNNTRGYIKTSVGYNEDNNIVQKSLWNALELPEDGYSIFKDYMTGLEYIHKNEDLHDQGLYVELGNYQGKCFLDWRLIEDDEYFHYAQLHKILGGQGVPSINDSLQEMIYKPLLTPIRDLINGKTLKILGDISKDNSAIIGEFPEKLKEFLDEAKTYAVAEGDTQVIIDGIMQKISAIEKLQNFKVLLNESITGLDENTVLHITSILPETILDCSILYAWNFVHLIGKIVRDQDYEIISRSWIDEWRIGNVLEWVFGEIKEEEEDQWTAVYMVKLLTSLQNWYNQKPSGEEKKSYWLLKKLLSEPDVQNYLKLNRFQDVLWFNEENFDTLCQWLTLIATVNKFAENDIKGINELSSIVRSWLNAAKDSQYKVENLMDAIKNNQ